MRGIQKDVIIQDIGHKELELGEAGSGTANAKVKFGFKLQR